jgi:flavin reductase (DIM6/NTAB) family NADH-FMN oxidoreductase RutF/DNA-binding GntR family transcriptional regulator
VTPALTSDEFREVMGRFASGVTVITTVDQGLRFGSTASAVSSLSLEPPMLLTCLNSSSATGRAIASAGRFAVNILGEDHSDVAVRFATRDIDKFQGIDIIDGLDDVPLLGEAIATMECEVSQTTTGGTHFVFLAEVRRARGQLGAPLAYFRGQFGRLELAEDAAAARAIRERVLHRRLPIAEPLNLVALAEEIKAPRGAVYHALAKLAAEGWVDRDADGSFVVPRVTRETLMASARARVAIFAGAAVAAIPGGTADHLAELRQMVRALAPGENGTVDPDWWFARRTAMVESLMRLSHTGTVLLDAFNRADVPAQIHSFLFPKGRTRRGELRHIHAGYASIIEACATGDHRVLTSAIAELNAHYESLYGKTTDEGDFAHERRGLSSLPGPEPRR